MGNGGGRCRCSSGGGALIRQWLLGADHGVGWRRESRVHRAADARARALVLVQRTSDRAGAETSRGKNDVKTGMTFEGDHVSISINAVEPPESEAEPFGRDTSAVDIASAVAAARAAEEEAAATEIPVAEVVEGGDGGDGEINGEADESEGAASASSKEMHAFMRQVAEVKKSDATLRSKLQMMRELHEQANAAVRADAVAELREKSRSEMGAISALGAATKKKLEALAQENAELIAENDGKYTAAMRSREALTVTMAKRLRATMVDFIELRQAIQEDYKKTVERRVFTVTGERPDDEELEELIGTGESEQVFEKAILEQGRGQVMDTVAEIHERHEAVKEIEQGLLALHQMFTDLATLVDQQVRGEVVNGGRRERPRHALR